MKLYICSLLEVQDYGVLWIQKYHLAQLRPSRHTLWRRISNHLLLATNKLQFIPTLPTMSLPRLARPKTLYIVLQPHNHAKLRPSLCLFRRNASTKAPDTSNLRPLVLEQPDKFRPPSHGARKPRKPRHFGPALTEEEIKAQNTKRYPHSMPPEGTVMYKFLTSKGIHVWISMVWVSTLFLDFMKSELGRHRSILTSRRHKS